MMIPCCSLSALLSGNSPLSVLQSHLPPHYLGGGALSYLKSVNWSWDLDLAISIGNDLLILLRSLDGRPGSFRAKMFSEAPRHHTLATSSPGQTLYNNCPPSLVATSSGCETLVLLALATCRSLIAH